MMETEETTVATASAAARTQRPLSPGRQRRRPPHSRLALTRHRLPLEPRLLLLHVALGFAQQRLRVEEDPVLDGPGHPAVFPLRLAGHQSVEAGAAPVHH